MCRCDTTSAHTWHVGVQAGQHCAGISNATTRLSYAQLTGSDPGPVNEASSTASATSGNLFRYDETSGQYVFNWSKKGLAMGRHRLFIDLWDGVPHPVDPGPK